MATKRKASAKKSPPKKTAKKKSSSKKAAKKGAGKKKAAGKKAKKKTAAKRTAPKKAAGKKAAKKAPGKKAPGKKAAGKKAAPRKAAPRKAKMAPAGSFVWFDIMTTNVDKAVRFYSWIFGWELKTIDMGPLGAYQMMHASGTPLGGIVGMEEGGPPPHWLPYVAVDDISKTIEQAKALGGKVHHGPDAIPDVGTFAVVSDPTGAPFAPIQMASPPLGGDVKGKLGMVAWREVMTDAPARTAAFYEALLPWTGKDMKMGDMTYHMFSLAGTGDVAGVMEKPAGSGPGGTWLAYVAVTNVDATVSRASDAGAHVVQDGFDVPGVGRMAILTDPQGAMFAVFTPST